MNKITASCDKCSILNEGLRRNSLGNSLGAIQRTLIAGGDQIWAETSKFWRSKPKQNLGAKKKAFQEEKKQDPEVRTGLMNWRNSKEVCVAATEGTKKKEEKIRSVAGKWQTQ